MREKLDRIYVCMECSKASIFRSEMDRHLCDSGHRRVNEFLLNTNSGWRSGFEQLN